MGRLGGCIIARSDVFSHTTRYPRPPPLCSPRITTDHRSYGWLRLPATVVLFLALYTCPRPCVSLHTNRRISLVNAPSQCKARHGLRSRGGSPRSPRRALSCCLLASRYHRPAPKRSFRDSTPSRSAPPVTLAPRLLSRLHIAEPVTRSQRKARYQTRG